MDTGFASLVTLPKTDLSKKKSPLVVDLDVQRYFDNHARVNKRNSCSSVLVLSALVPVQLIGTREPHFSV